MRFGLPGSLTSPGLPACCGLPMLLTLAGIGGSWIAAFGTFAAARLHILAETPLLSAAAWTGAWRQGSLYPLAGRPGASRSVTGFARAIAVNEAGPNDLRTGWM